MWLVFFFQAEDGIRGHCVTGVQTCALPIFMSCGRMENRVLPYVDGRLKEGERRDVEKHLATCAACRLRVRSEEHTSELQSHSDLVCRLLLEKKKKKHEILKNK